MADDFRTKIVVTKLDAARQQLRTAIRLWFGEGDPIAIHTLAAAAYEIIHVLSKKHDKYRPRLIFDTDIIKDEYRADWCIKIKMNANFFKHARDDPDGTLEFFPSLTMLFLMAGASGLRIMNEKPGREELAFFYWCCFHHPDWIKPDFRKTLEDRIPVQGIEHIMSVQKADFMKVFDIAIQPG
jgi:hypothetical protein